MSIDLPGGGTLGPSSIPGSQIQWGRPKFGTFTTPTTPSGTTAVRPDPQFWWDGKQDRYLDDVNISWATLPQKDKNWWIAKAAIRYGGDPRSATWAPGFYADSVSMSAQFKLNGQDVTPKSAANQFLGNLQKKQDDGSSSSGSGGGAAPTVSSQNMQRLADQTMQAKVGREATRAEGKELTRQVRQGLASDPTNTDPTYVAEQLAKNTPGATTMSANNYMRVFLQSLGGIGG